MLKANIMCCFVVFAIINACQSPNSTPANEQVIQEYVKVEHPEWTKNANIYEVNIRQYTKEGTFKAFEEHLPRLKKMGVSILWIMPIHPIGKLGRKGSLGSPYSVQDYYGINPEFGDLDSFKHLVNKIHELGMYVIIDWVANHSARDNALVKEHPDWYLKGRDGQYISTPWRDYDDIIDFDYSKPALRSYMSAAMQYWVKETNIDGFRCDVASFVPIEFWEQTRQALNKLKPVFMLAEAADRDLHQSAFDMTYSWALWDVLHQVTTKNVKLDLLAGGYIAEHVSIWPRDAYRMNFVDNHDKNAWEGTSYANFGDGLAAAIVLTGTMDGMPMMYSGQESGLTYALPFFEKQQIQWKKDTIGSIYTKLFLLKQKNHALWNGRWGGEMLRLKNNTPEQVLSFVRAKDGDKVLVMVNMSPKKVITTIETKFDQGTYQELFTGENFRINNQHLVTLSPWDYKVLVKVQ